MTLTPIQEQIVRMKTMAADLVRYTADLETADAQAVDEINGKGLSAETYNNVKAAVDACHVVALQHYGLGIIVHNDMAKIQPAPPESQELGGGGGKVEPPYPPGP